MNKKVLISTIVLLTLSMMVLSPVKAITKETYTMHMELELKDPGIQWVSEEGILHMRDFHWMGTVEGTLGTGTYDGWVSVNINLATQEGTVSEKWVITITSQDTLAGSSRGKLTMPFVSGTFVGTHGTGDFEGVKIMGSYEGFHPDLTHIVADAEGTIKHP
ncbi:MAG: hypothetical protein OEY81_05535 [Candidatus Bathyarchaeota archaeon]|nr:hypothetical protein [Candidatus Bathyarchaeota archaeon]